MATLKIQSAEIEPFWATPEILLFLMMIFFNFFHNHMVQKYQNEISPTIYYGISTKTNEKDLKIPTLQPPDWKNPYWMSLYLSIYQSISTSCQLCLHCVFCAEYSLMFCCQALFFLPRYLFQGNEVWLPDKKEFFRRILEPFWKDAFVPWYFIKAT